MTPTRNRRGRPRRQGTMIVNVRIPMVVYDAYCARAAKAGPEVAVRSVMQRVLAQNVRVTDLDARQQRAFAIALLQAADDTDRPEERRATPRPEDRAGEVRPRARSAN